MAKGYDISQNIEGIKEIKNNLETKKSEISKLEEQKQQLLDAVTDISGANIDENTKKAVNDALNSSLEVNSQKGQEISNEMGSEMKRLEEIKQDTMDSVFDATSQKASIDKKKNLLDRFGIGGMLERATGALDANIQELSDIKDESIEVMRELEKASQKAGMI